VAEPKVNEASVSGHYPGRAPFEAYGNGGFRFAGMSHKGAVIALPSGVWAWGISTPDQITVAALTRIFGEPRGGEFQFLLLGTGASQVFPSPEVRRAFADCAIGLDVMTTGAAARTYNVLLAEGRPVGAALLAVV
jgi:uncharacterized protein